MRLTAKRDFEQIAVYAAAGDALPGAWAPGMRAVQADRALAAMRLARERMFSASTASENAIAA